MVVVERTIVHQCREMELLSLLDFDQGHIINRL